MPRHTSVPGRLRRLVSWLVVGALPAGALSAVLVGATPAVAAAPVGPGDRPVRPRGVRPGIWMRTLQ